MQLHKMSKTEEPMVVKLTKPLTKIVVKRKCKEKGISFPDKYEERLQKYSELSPEYKVYFSAFKGDFEKTLNAYSSHEKTIIFNCEWAVHLIINKDGVYETFIETLGHEITHKKKWFKVWNLIGSKRRFVCWTNEVYADFGSSLEINGVDKSTILTAMQYKLKAKTDKKLEGLTGEKREKKMKKIDRDTDTHPSWNRRIKYVTKHDFNQNLVRQIAIDTNYLSPTKDAHYQHSDKDAFIAKVADFFPEIILDASLNNGT